MKRFIDELKVDLRRKRQELNWVDSLIDYVQELEQEVQHWKSRYEILLEGKTEQANEEEIYGSSHLDK